MLNKRPLKTLSLLRLGPPAAIEYMGCNTAPRGTWESCQHSWRSQLWQLCFVKREILVLLSIPSYVMQSMAQLGSTKAEQRTVWRWRPSLPIFKFLFFDFQVAFCKRNLRKWSLFPGSVFAQRGSLPKSCSHIPSQHGKRRTIQSNMAPAAMQI